MKKGSMGYNDGVKAGSPGTGKTASHGNVVRSSLPNDGDCKVPKPRK